MYDAGNPKSVLCDSLGGCDGERGGRQVQDGGNLMSIHVNVWQKLSPYVKTLSSNLKEKKKKLG